MASSLKMFAFAKINLALAVVGKRDDGYHNIESVLQTIGLHDLVHVELTAQGISCDCGSLSGPDNLAYRAAGLFINKLSSENISHQGVKIVIEKHIPWEAGLAGGSSDGAAVLNALNQLYHEPLSRQQLLEMAADLGADVAFCLNGGTAWAEGRGERLISLPPVPQLDLVIVKPKAGVSTRESYTRFGQLGRYSRLSRNNWENALKAGNREELFKLMQNDLEQPSSELVPEIAEIKGRLLAQGCFQALMCGSGSAVFGVVRDKEEALKIGESFKNCGYQVWTTNTLN